MAYSDKVIDHYSNPRNVGSFAKDTPGVGTGLVGAPECGDVMKLQIKVNVETGVIEDAKFKTFGCGSAIASSSLATEWLKGRTVDDAAKIKNTDIVKELMKAQHLENVHLRMGVKGGGCSGLSYSLEFDNEVGPHDKKFDIDGIQVVCDAKSYLYLNGTTLDYVQQGLTGGFTFVNPNAKSSCGCGTSFSA